MLIIGPGGHDDVAGLAGDEVERTRRGGSECRIEALVEQDPVLRVIPKRGDGVPVVVVHDLLVSGLVAPVVRKRGGAVGGRDATGHAGWEAAVGRAGAIRAFVV